MVPLRWRLLRSKQKVLHLLPLAHFRVRSQNFRSIFVSIGVSVENRAIGMTRPIVQNQAFHPSLAIAPLCRVHRLRGCMKIQKLYEYGWLVETRLG